MKTLKITKHFETLAAAVAEAKPDLSYNETEAQASIKATDRHTERAFITEDGRIWSVYKCDIRILNEFQPFVSVLSDSPFRVAYIEGDTLAMFDTLIPKSTSGRRWFAEDNFGALAY